MTVRCILMIALCCLAIPAFAINGLWVHPERVITPTVADKTLDQARRSGVDNIYLLVFYREQAWFRTALCPMSGGVKDGFDPLGYCIQGGHKRGMKVHAWFVNGEAGDSGGPGAIMSKHPDWQAENAQGGKSLWFDFTKAEVRRFQKDLMLSAVKGYPGLDGVHFDYIRFPDASLGYGPTSLKAFRKATGLDPPKWDRFPIRIALSANPAHDVTTAKPLARFQTGMPAITENNLGNGRVLLFNWHAETTRLSVLDSFLRSKLGEFGASSKAVKVLRSAENDKRYGGGSRGAAFGWLDRAGFKATEAELGQCGVGDVLIAPCVYVWTAEDAAKLRGLVEKGMCVVWIDGPATSLADILSVLGVDRPDSWFAARMLITPVVADPGMPVEKDPKAARLLEKREETWKQWRQDRVTDLVRDVYRSAKRARPSVTVSAAVFYTRDAADTVLQDWQRWVREGCVDYVIPMAYVDDAMLETAFKEWERLPRWRERVIPGLSIYAQDDGAAVPKLAEPVRRQVDICAKHGSSGIVFFCCHYISPELESILKNAAPKE